MLTFAFLSPLLRDLTARNILISEKNTVKVSNFELTRDATFCLSECKFPIKWTAPEAIDNGVSMLEDVGEKDEREMYMGRREYQKQSCTKLPLAVIPYRNSFCTTV